MSFTKNDVLEELASVAFADPESEDWLSVGDKLKALDMLARHFGIYEADNVQKESVPPLQIVWIDKDGKPSQSALPIIDAEVENEKD